EVDRRVEPGEGGLEVPQPGRVDPAVALLPRGADDPPCPYGGVGGRAGHRRPGGGVGGRGGHPHIVTRPGPRGKAFLSRDPPWCGSDSDTGGGLRDDGRVNQSEDPTPATADDDARLFPRVTAYRFRRGTMRPGQQRNWDEHWPTYGRNVADELVDREEWFGRDAPLILEIGSGTGTSTAAMAAAEPDVDVIAVEVYQPGLAQLLGMILREELHNVRMIRGDGVDVLTNMIAPASLTGVRVFFPDPWPKARHHKRRLLQSGTFDLIASRLRPGGVLHVATDHADYAEWIGATGDAEPALERIDAQSDAGHVPFTLERPVTKFEGKGLREDREIAEFLWRRGAAPGQDTQRRY